MKSTFRNEIQQNNFIDYEKAFNRVDQHKMLKAFTEYRRIEHRYTTLIGNTYKTVTAGI